MGEMKTLKIFLWSLLLLVVAGSLTSAAVFEDDFESGGRNWKSKHYKSATMSEVVTEGKAGGSCYKISGASGDTAFQLTSPEFPVEGGASYKITFDAKHNFNYQKVSGCRNDWWTEIIWYGANKTKISTTRVNGFDGPNTEWHQDRASGLVAPANAQYARFQFGADVPNLTSGQYIYVDNFKVEKE